MTSYTDGLSFVLPVATENTGRDHLDVLRMQILLRSFMRFFSLGDLDTFWVVTPARDSAAVREAIRTVASDQRIVHLPEEELTTAMPPEAGGWFQQQLIKLAIADRVTSRHYVTLDSDLCP